MKHSSLFLLPIFTACCLAIAPSAQAQRESFDATVVRKAEVLIVEMLTPEPTVFHNILFKFDSAELLDKSSEDQVDEIAHALKSPRLKGVRFRVEGHTCDLGDDDYNLKLSAQRAQTIRQRLIKQGVPADRLVAQGLGESELVTAVKPADSPDQAEAKRKKSRRVVMRNLGTSPAGK